MAAKPHLLIVEARFYDDIADELLRGAREALARAGAEAEVLTVPGALEIPAMLEVALDAAEAAGRPYEAAVALGCVIRGETTHYDYICGESARALMDLAVHRKLAIGYGILTVETLEQALARAQVARGDKGGDAAHACLAMVALGRRWRPS